MKYLLKTSQVKGLPGNIPSLTLVDVANIKDGTAVPLGTTISMLPPKVVEDRLIGDIFNDAGLNRRPVNSAA